MYTWMSIYVLYYICYKLTPLENQGPVNLKFKKHCFGRINRGVYMRRLIRLDYKQLIETGEKLEKEQVEGNQIEEESNLFRINQCRLVITQRRGEKSMGKQKADAFVIDKATIGEDIDDYNDGNNVIKRRS